MVQRNSNDWVRKAEMLSLTINIVGWSLGFLVIAVLSWYILLPATSSPIAVELGTLLLLLFGITCNTRFNIGGLVFIPAFKNYLKQTETEQDKAIARASFLGTFGLFAVYYGILSIIFSL